MMRTMIFMRKTLDKTVADKMVAISCIDFNSIEFNLY